ncbi:hypothetical protein KCU90_g5159, partial [Aureobasidium melanogenum]
MRTTAVIGICIDAARNAVAPTTAKAPKEAPGQNRLQAPPSTIASNAPFASPGVSRPPSAPARKLLTVITTFSTSSMAASAIVRLPSNASPAGPLPLPSNCGKCIASTPMIAKFNSDNTGKRQSFGAWARARFVTSANPHAATPKIGPHTTDQTTSATELRDQRRHCGGHHGRYQGLPAEGAQQNLEHKYRAAERHVIDGGQTRAGAACDHDPALLD